MKSLLYLFLFLPLCCWSQDHHLSVFEPLLGATWHAEGYWGNGTPFKQELDYSYALDSTLVMVHTKGFIDESQKQFGQRNHGIRQYNAKLGVIQFWEFDIYGMVTTGAVTCEDKNFVYTYLYGDTTVTEEWKYQDEETYTLVIGIYEEGKWLKKFLETKLVKNNENNER